MQLAAADTYVELTFWFGVPVAIGTIVIVVLAIRDTWNRPKRLLYWMSTVTPFFGFQQDLRQHLEVHRGEQVMRDPHVIKVGLFNPGRTEIRRAAFEGGEPLRLDVGARIIEHLKSTSNPEYRAIPNTAVDGSELKIGPGLISHRQTILFDLLVDGSAPSLTCPERQLAGIDLRQRADDYDPLRPFFKTRRGRLMIAIAVASLLLACYGAGVDFIARRQTSGRPYRIPLHSELSDPNTSGVSSAAFSPDGRRLALGDFNGTTYLWNPATRRIATTLPNPNGQDIFDLTFGPGGNVLAVVTQNSTYTDGDVYLWNIAKQAIIATLHDPRAGGPDAVAFSPNDGILAVGDKNGSTDLWDLATDKILHTLPDPNGQSIRSLAFNPSGSILAVASGHVDTTYLWNPNTYRIIRPISDASGGGINDLTFSPDGRTLAGADTDGDTYLWDVGNGKLIKLVTTLRNPNGHQASSVAFSPDGRVVAVTTSYENTIGYIYLWNVTTRTRKPIATLQDPRSSGTLADAFSPDGTFLAVSDNNLSNYLWNIKRLPPQIFRNYRDDK